MARVKKRNWSRTPKPSGTRLRPTTHNEVETSTLLRIVAYRKSYETLLEFARINLAACLETHQSRCPTQASDLTGFLPTRLIDLHTMARPKLVRSRSIRSKDTRYACLSHQWGKPDMNARSVMTTVKSNLQSRLKGFDLENLPERYQEAMIICHLLGVRYIWIDSLCIIQDDASDWKTESAMMARVYEGGHFTIASNVPVDDQEWKAPEGLRELSTWGRSQEDWFSALLTEGPLGLRAWCLQERHMSSRILHVFAGDTWIFECQYKVRAATHQGLMFSYHCSDPSCGVSSWVKFRIYDGLSSRQLLQRWYVAVEDFSKRALSYEADKLPAISGIAAKIQPLLCSDYLCGIWREDLYGLIWHRDIKPLPTYSPLLPWAEVRRQKIAKVPSSYRAPSFSWASVEEKVRFLSLHHVGDPGGPSIIYLASVRCLGIISDKGDHLGRVQEGSYIKLSGRFWDPLEDTKVYLDFRPEDILVNAFYFIIGVHFGGEFPNRYNVLIGLVLSLVDTRHQNYKRTGVFEFPLQKLECLKTANSDAYAASGEKLSNKAEVAVLKRNLGPKKWVNIF